MRNAQYFIDDLIDRSDLVRRFLVVWVSVLAFAVNGSGQISPGAVLVGEIGSFPCDGFRGYIDIFLSELRDNPGWHGTVVNIGREESEVSAVIREEMFRSHLVFRRFDESRVSYSRMVGNDFKTQIFRSPNANGNTANAGKNYVLTSVTSPVVIKDYEFDDFCPQVNYRALFGDLLSQNPSSSATILVRDRSKYKATKRQKELSKYLVGTNKISADRIRFMVSSRPDFDYGNDPYVEYRYIP